MGTNETIVLDDITQGDGHVLLLSRQNLQAYTRGTYVLGRRAKDFLDGLAGIVVEEAEDEEVLLTVRRLTEQLRMERKAVNRSLIDLSTHHCLSALPYQTPSGRLLPKTRVFRLQPPPQSLATAKKPAAMRGRKAASLLTQRLTEAELFTDLPDPRSMATSAVPQLLAPWERVVAPAGVKAQRHVAAPFRGTQTEALARVDTFVVNVSVLQTIYAALSLTLEYLWAQKQVLLESGKAPENRIPIQLKALTEMRGMARSGNSYAMIRAEMRSADGTTFNLRDLEPHFSNLLDLHAWKTESFRWFTIQQAISLDPHELRQDGQFEDNAVMYVIEWNTGVFNQLIAAAFHFALPKAVLRFSPMTFVLYQRCRVIFSGAGTWKQDWHPNKIAFELNIGVEDVLQRLPDQLRRDADRQQLRWRERSWSGGSFLLLNLLGYRLFFQLDADGAVVSMRIKCNRDEVLQEALPGSQEQQKSPTVSNPLQALPIAGEDKQARTLRRIQSSLRARCSTFRARKTQYYVDLKLNDEELRLSHYSCQDEFEQVANALEGSDVLPSEVLMYLLHLRDSRLPLRSGSAEAGNERVITRADIECVVQQLAQEHAVFLEPNEVVEYLKVAHPLRRQFHTSQGQAAVVQRLAAKYC